MYYYKIERIMNICNEVVFYEVINTIEETILLITPNLGLNHVFQCQTEGRNISKWQRTWNTQQ